MDGPATIITHACPTRVCVCFQMWDTLLAKVEEQLSNAELKETVKKLLAEGFEKELGLVSTSLK